MWTTLGLAAALTLAPAQTDALDLTNIRPVYGYLGTARPNSKLLPGDVFFVTFEIDNIKVSPVGEVLYSMGMELLDGKGKTQFKKDPESLKALNSLGGKSLPAMAHVDIGLDTAPGKYTLKVTVTDQSTKTNSSKSFEREFEVVPMEFGLVRLNLTYDVEGRTPAPATGVPGQSVFLNLAAVGFKRNKDEPNVSVEMAIQDGAGKPVLAKPFTAEVKELPREYQALPMQFRVDLNRPGKFTVKLKATDNVSKKTAELTFPLTVLETK
jgi:hypothetical protein